MSRKSPGGFSVYTNVHDEYRLEPGEPVLPGWFQIGWINGRRRDAERYLEELRELRRGNPPMHPWRDERGVETLEWLAIAVLILMVAFAIYPGTLQGGLTQVVNAITNALTAGVPPIGGGN